MSETTNVIETRRAGFRRDGHCPVTLVTAVTKPCDYLKNFVEYYRRQGVCEFVILIDSACRENVTYLSSQQDVVLYTEASGAQNTDYLMRLDSLRNTHCAERWCLNVESNELFSFPLSDYFGVSHLCGYLEQKDFESIYSIRLDFYPNKSSAKHEQSESSGPPWKFYNHFDNSGYRVVPKPDFPYFEVLGGPMAGFASDHTSLVRIPLVKWRPGMSYNTKSMLNDPVNLADIVSCLFGFQALFEKGDYQSKFSEKYRHADQLLKYGFHTISGDFLDWAYENLRRADVRLDSPKIETFKRYKKASLLEGRREIAEYAEWLDFWDSHLNYLNLASNK